MIMYFYAKRVVKWLLEYYMNNISGSLVLFDEMRNHGVKNIIFSCNLLIYFKTKIYNLKTIEITQKKLNILI